MPVIGLSGGSPVQVDDRVYIIQHPHGGAKKIGMIHNVVRYVDDDVIRYWTDTESGSSGSRSSTSDGRSWRCITTG